MPDERSIATSFGSWKRFLLAALGIVVLSGAATATVVLNTASSIAEKVFRNTVAAPASVVTPVYNGAPQTFLILGSDRRGQASVIGSGEASRSDTILLVRFDPGRGQTSLLSIPRDLDVNITAPGGGYYPEEKVNAAYSIGFKLDGARGAMLLAAETIEHEVFPGLKLNGIIDVSFAGFINVVDALGCVYVNVDHRYYHVNTGFSEEYSEINLQPGYQKLCYNNALGYVRFRHEDSDFVRVARQQDFMRDLRSQASRSLTGLLGKIDTVANDVGNAIASTFQRSGSELIKLAELVIFSQGRPLRQVKFRALDVAAQIRGASYVTTTPELARATLNDFLYGAQRLVVPHQATSRASRAHGRHSASPSAGAAGLVRSDPTGSSALAGQRAYLPFPILFPALQTAPASEQTTRAYDLRDTHGKVRHAYVTVWQQTGLGGYYDFEGTDWPDPPLIAHPDETRVFGGVRYMFFADGTHIHTIAWRSGGALYWVANTLLEDLTNEQMLLIARSARAVR